MQGPCLCTYVELQQIECPKSMQFRRAHSRRCSSNGPEFSRGTSCKSRPTAVPVVETGAVVKHWMLGVKLRSWLVPSAVARLGVRLLGPFFSGQCPCGHHFVWCKLPHRSFVPVRRGHFSILLSFCPLLPSLPLSTTVVTRSGGFPSPVVAFLFPLLPLSQRPSLGLHPASRLSSVTCSRKGHRGAERAFSVAAATSPHPTAKIPHHARTRETLSRHCPTTLA